MSPVSYTAYPTNLTKYLSTFTRIVDFTTAVLVVSKKELEIGAGFGVTQTIKVDFSQP